MFKYEIEFFWRYLGYGTHSIPSKNPFVSHVMPIRKRDCSFIMCIDCWELTKRDINNIYPIQRIDGLSIELYGAMIFTKIDLRSCYYQIRVRVAKHFNKKFRIHHVHFEFQVVPSGLSIPPNYFSRYHEWNFQNLILCSSIMKHLYNNR